MDRQRSILCLCTTILAATAAGSLFEEAARGSVIQVPADQPNIQAAIAAAVDGDVVVVAPGTYTGWANRNLDFAGKAITVRSTDPGDPAVVAATVIDCGQAGRGFIFQSGETPASVVDGLTIINGFATDGAGVFLLNGSGATIRSCVFSQNTVPDFRGVIQSGNNPVEPAELQIIDCTIQNNLGGGFTSYFIDTLTIRGCTISGNTGPGISMSTFGTAHARVEGCTITANGGAGINLKGGLLEVFDCTVTDHAETGVSLNVSSGAIFDGDSVEISNSIISRNSSLTTVGGLKVHNQAGTSVLVRSCLITDNIGRTAGGMQLSGFENFLITTSTIADNTATELGGGGIRVTGGSPGASTDIRNCIIWGNTAPEGDQLLLNSLFNNPAIVSVDFCDLQGGAASVAIDTACCSPSQLLFGKNNLDTNPLFLDPASGDYHLAAESPAINAGDPGFVAAAGETDIDGDPRVVGAQVDLGADEFRHPADLNGDCAVNVLDLIQVLLAFGSAEAASDINGDGVVNVLDLIELLLAFGSAC